MTNTINNRIMIVSSAILLIAVFGLAMGAFPSSAHAQFYTPSQYYSNCAYPTVYTNGYWTCSNPSVTYVQNQQPNYYYPPNYYPNNPQQPLSVSCYPASTSVQAGMTVQWVASPLGGNGQFSYSWTGSDGLTGTGQTATISYANAGTKTAQVTVYSGGQSQVASCSNFVTVYNTVTAGYNYYPTNYVYSNSYYPYSTQTYFPAIAASCVANTTYAALGQTVTWTASATGGNGYYNYSWSGSDGIGGQGQSIAYTYPTIGSKLASVTVNSNGQNITVPCSNAVSIGAPTGSTQNFYGFSTGYSSASSGLDIGCYADPASISVNQPVTWSSEVAGGVGPYKYSWTGTDNLSGESQTVIKYYASAGTKSAILTVTSADGRSATRACSTGLRVTGGASSSSGSSAATPAPVQVQPGQQGLTAASAFSLSGIPWGWVAVLVILVLFATVMYLLFNKPKI